MKIFLKSKLLGLTVISGSARLFGLIRDVLFASVYGTGILAAAYEGAARIPISLFDIFFGCAIGNALIPIICHARCDGEDRGDAFANGSAGVILLASSAITLIGMICSNVILHFFTEGLSAAAFDLANTLLLTLFPTLFLNSFSYFLIAVLHSKGYFIFPAAISLSGSVLSIIYLLFTSCGIEGLALVSVFGSALQLIILYFYSKSVGYRCRPTPRLDGAYSKKALFLTLQGALPCALTPIMELISISYSDRYMSGRGITVFLYANRIFIMCAGFFAFVFSSFLLPLLSREEAEGRGEASRREFVRYAVLLLAILVPITLTVLIFPKEIVRMIFGHGSFDEYDVETCAGVLRTMALGIPFFAMSEISVKAYFAKRRCLYPTLCAAVSLCVFVLGLGISPYGSRMTDLSFFLAVTYIIYGVSLFVGLMIRKKEKADH